MCYMSECLGDRLELSISVYIILIGVCVSCCISYSVIKYLYVSFIGLTMSVWEERAYVSAIDYS